MQPFQLHLTHVTTLPHPHLSTLISRVTELLLFHPLVPVHRRSGGIHTTLSPGMNIHTHKKNKKTCCLLASWHEDPSPQGSAWLPKLRIYRNKKKKEKKKELSSAGEGLVKKPNRVGSRFLKIKEAACEGSAGHVVNAHTQICT